MQQQLKIGAPEAAVVEVEGYGLTAGDAHKLCDFAVALLKGLHSLRRMQVQRDVQTHPVQTRQQLVRLRDELPVPGVTCPAAVSLRHASEVPVHIQHGHGKGRSLGGKALHELKVFLRCIRPEAAPPVAEGEAREKRGTSTEAEKVPQAALKLPAVQEQIDIPRPRTPRLELAVRAEEQTVIRKEPDAFP